MEVEGGGRGVMGLRRVYLSSCLFIGSGTVNYRHYDSGMDRYTPSY